MIKLKLWIYPRVRCSSMLTSILAVLCFVWGCDSAPTKPNTIEEKINAMSAMQKNYLQFALTGNEVQSVEELQGKFDRAFEIYHLAPSELHYLNAGESLIFIGKRYGVAEMDILNLMLEVEQNPDWHMTFDSAADQAAWALQVSRGRDRFARRIYEGSIRKGIEERNKGQLKKKGIEKNTKE